VKIQLIIVLFLFLIVSTIFADDEETPIINYQLCGVINGNVREEIDVFFSKVLKNLNDTMIELQFELMCETYEGYLLDGIIAFTRIFEGTVVGVSDKIIIHSILSNNAIKTVSPMLYNTLPITFSLSDKNAYHEFSLYIRYALGENQPLEDYLLAMKSTESENTIVNYYLGNIALTNNNYELAIERYNNQYFTDDNRFYGTNLAWALVQVGESQRALEIMTEGVNSGEYTSQILIDRAQIYALAFNYTSAIQDMDSAINLLQYDIDTKLSKAYKQRGDIIMLIYEWNSALEDYNTAIELDPDYAEAYYRRGILLYTMVEREDAIADFETYLELDFDGQFAESATEYIENIQTELGALGG
jgi:tetratricopeptide (TPR) repeat protein